MIPEWTPNDAAWAALFLSGTVAYLLYHYGASAPRFEGLLRAKGWLNEHAQAGGVYLQRIAGGLLLGGAAVALLATLFEGGPTQHGLGALEPAHALAALGVLALLPILWAAAGGEVHQARYPMVRQPSWSPRDVALNTGTWALYLVGYELFFRGLLVLGLAAWIGAWPAIFAQTALYTFAHLPKDAGETAGCVAMGVLFGLLAYTTGAVWAPVLLHLAIAVTSDMLSVWRSPDRGFSWRSPAWASSSSHPA